MKADFEFHHACSLVVLLMEWMLSLCLAFGVAKTRHVNYMLRPIGCRAFLLLGKISTYGLSILKFGQKITSLLIEIKIHMMMFLSYKKLAVDNTIFS